MVEIDGSRFSGSGIVLGYPLMAMAVLYRS
jgi:hypothetical protein